MDRTRSIIWADVADAQGDVDAYMARYSAEHLTYGTIAPDVARRLLIAERLHEAFEIITCARNAEAAQALLMFYEVHEDCLEKRGRRDDLKHHLWETFSQTLNGATLSRYLKLFPDFDHMRPRTAPLLLLKPTPIWVPRSIS